MYEGGCTGRAVHPTGPPRVAGRLRTVADPTGRQSPVAVARFDLNLNGRKTHARDKYGKDGIP